MSTTNTYQGYDEAKPSSRVLRPPGGGSSNIFGTEQYQERTSPKKAPTHSNIFGDPTVNAQDDKVGKRRGGPPDNSRDNVFGGSTIEDKTRSENKRRGQEQMTEPRGRSQRFLNPITGEVSAKEDEKCQSGDGDGTQAYHSSSRVLAPPGGKSSGPLW